MAIVVGRSPASRPNARGRTAVTIPASAAPIAIASAASARKRKTRPKPVANPLAAPHIRLVVLGLPPKIRNAGTSRASPIHCDATATCRGLARRETRPPTKSPEPKRIAAPRLRRKVTLPAHQLLAEIDCLGRVGCIPMPRLSRRPTFGDIRGWITRSLIAFADSAASTSSGR